MLERREREREMREREGVFVCLCFRLLVLVCGGVRCKIINMQNIICGGESFNESLTEV